jgi:hypothetical protein
VPLTLPPVWRRPLPRSTLADWCSSMPAPAPPPGLREKEDGVTKCICTYTDDDGNAIFCKRCQTWQHIRCYYSNRKIPDLHSCADCEPSSLDTKGATERQKRLAEKFGNGDQESEQAARTSQKTETIASTTIAEHSMCPDQPLAAIPAPDASDSHSLKQDTGIDIAAHRKRLWPTALGSRALASRSYTALPPTSATSTGGSNSHLPHRKRHSKSLARNFNVRYSGIRKRKPSRLNVDVFPEVEAAYEWLQCH